MHNNTKRYCFNMFMRAVYHIQLPVTRRKVTIRKGNSIPQVTEYFVLPSAFPMRASSIASYSPPSAVCVIVQKKNAGGV